MKYPNVYLCATLVGKMVEGEVGVEKLTADFNRYRKNLKLAPVQKKTVIRYNNGGSGYNTTPKHYRRFIANYVGLI